VTARLPRASLDRELARARGARRLLPWSILSAAGGGAIGLAAGGGLRAAGAISGLLLVFALFLWVTSIARCPACGERLPAGRGRLEACPGCRARFG
jgi:hypothetical protein